MTTLKKLIALVLCLCLLGGGMTLATNAAAGYQGTYELTIGKSQTITLSTGDSPMVAFWDFSNSSYYNYVSIDSQSTSSCRVTAKQYYSGGSITLRCTYYYYDKYNKYTSTVVSYVLVINRPVLTVTFNPNGGSVSQTTKQVNHSDSIGTMPTPTKSGYTFTGWYYSDGTLAHVYDTCTENITLTAYWTLTIDEPTAAPTEAPTVPFADMTQSNEEDFEINYLSSTTAEIIGYVGAAEHVSIPEKIGNTRIVSISEYAFEQNDTMLALTIPNTITEIGEYAFQGCSRLSDIKFGTGLQSIAPFTFSNCTALMSVSLPNNITSIGENAFENCLSLKTLSMPGVVTIGTMAFYSCAALDDLTLPSTLLTVERFAFCGCSGLQGVTFNSAVSIEGKAFYLCSGISTLTFPNNIASIEHDAFQGCDALAEIRGYIMTASEEYAQANHIPFVDLTFGYTPIDSTTATLTYFGGIATDVVVPSEIDGYTITAIGNNVFAKNENITSLTIPDTVTTLGSGIANNCTNLEVVRFSDNITHIDNGTTFSNTKWKSSLPTGEIVYAGKVAYYYRGTATQLIFKEGTTQIGYFAISDSKLEAFALPESVTEIGSQAFRNAVSSLKYIYIPGTVKTIGDRAFYYCNPQTIMLGEGIKSIGYMAFCATSSTSAALYLTHAYVPGSVTSMEEHAIGCREKVGTIYFSNLEAATYYAPKNSVAEKAMKNQGLTVTSLSSTAPGSVSVVKSQLSAEVGEPLALISNVSLVRGTDNALSWVSSDDRIAVINSYGVLTPKRPGSTTITVSTVNDKTASFTVTVTGEVVEAETIELSDTEITLEVSQTKTLTAQVLPENAVDNQVFWSTSKASVARVQNGTITARSVGDAIITARTENDITATCVVHVIEKLPDPTEAPTETPTQTPTEAPLLGDADGDGEVSVFDATIIQRLLAKYAIPEGFSEAYADVDGDGEVSIFDATFIQQYLAKYSVPYPIGDPLTD